MSFVVSTWSAYDADWLVQGKCQQAACTLQSLEFKDIKITTGSGGVDPIPPTPVDHYTYGDSCGTPYDDDCNGCDCHWSWPDGQDWSGPDAKCRCM